MPLISVDPAHLRQLKAQVADLAEQAVQGRLVRAGPEMTVWSMSSLATCNPSNQADHMLSIKIDPTCVQP